MDFSKAERKGFIQAFVEFWTMQPNDKRSRNELKKAAKALLKGCREHWRAALTRLSRINGVIPPEHRDAFVKRCQRLLDLESSSEFIQQAVLIVEDFPKLKSWMDWWTRPSVAAMLFNSERVMDINIWESIPDTTNAEESMHWKLYSAFGKHHSLLTGLNALWAFAVYYKRMFEGVSSK